MRFPGRSFLSPPKPDTPVAPAPAPKRDDPVIADTRKKARDAALRRRGRRASNVTGGQGVGDEGLGSTPTASGVPDKDTLG